MDSKVVHAQRGFRDRYEPIVSNLTNSSNPIILAKALLKKTRSKILYIADLDAIQGGSIQTKIISKIANFFCDTNIWLDAGFKSSLDFTNLIQNSSFSANKTKNILPVFSSESLLSIESAMQAIALFPESILSLDKKNNRFLGESNIAKHAELWPSKVILMNLDKVGSAEGPDLEWIMKVKLVNSKAALFGAGGLRDKKDTFKALSAGASGWLCSSTIHLNLIDYGE